MLKLWLGLVLTLLLTGCGDLFMKNSEDGEVELDQFATCELDIDAFSYILEKNIKGEILCLKEQLDLFMDVIRTDKPGYVSKSVLTDFLINGPVEVEDDVVDIVENIFELSFLILGTDREYIKREDVYSLIDFLVFFNEHIWRSYKFFNSEDDINYSRQLRERQIIFDEFALIAGKIREIYRPQRNGVDVIDTEKFIFKFFKKEGQTLEKIRSLMFLKRLFLGGQIWELNHLEISRALEILPYLAQVAFDVSKIENYKFEQEQETLIKVFMKDINIVKDTMFYTEDSFESVFTVYDVINAVKTMIPDLTDDIDVAKYPREIMRVKEIFLGAGGEFFSSKEIATFLNLGASILDEAITFYRIYTYYQNELDDTKPISHDFSDYPVTNSRELSYRENFARIVSGYKFVKGNSISPYFTHDWRRNANAYFQIGALERLIGYVFDFYGSNNPSARGGYDMTLDETVNLIKDFKWLLRDFGIIVIGKKGGGEIQGVAENFVLMSTLFQFQSDGCGDSVCMEVPETMEFLIGMLTALEIKDFFTDTMMSLCATELDQYNRIAPTCFRDNFLNVLETSIPSDKEGRAISDFMPLLHKYIKELTADIEPNEPITNSPDYLKFITETEAFTRSCMYYDEADTDEVYLKSNDAFAVFAGLLNVESTLLRFDINGNNKLDGVNGFNEVMHAYYNVYEGAIKALVAPDGGFMEKLAKPIFKYLIKNGTVPETNRFSSIWKFVKFLLKRNKDADASRTTVATILKTLGEQSETGKLYPFKCEECLRDPTIECVPEGNDWEPRNTSTY